MQCDMYLILLFFKQKTAYEMRISDCSSDVCSSDLILLTADMRGDAQALAFQNKMVADLRTDTGMEARTVDSFIYSNEKFLNGEASAEAFAARKADLAGAYLVVDEASMISNERMDKLTAIANLMEEIGRAHV